MTARIWIPACNQHVPVVSMRNAFSDDIRITIGVIDHKQPRMHIPREPLVNRHHGVLDSSSSRLAMLSDEFEAPLHRLWTSRIDPEDVLESGKARKSICTANSLASHSLISTLISELHANLSLSNTSHPVQKELLPSLLLTTRAKVLFQSV
jgi:hypothetical protein